MENEKNMTATAPSEDEYSDEEVRSRSRRRGGRRNRGRPQGGGMGNQALQPVGQLGNEVSKATGQVTDTVSGATGAVSGVASGLTGGGGGQKKDTLRLRLDLNLDIEVTLKARIHGDLELALLAGMHDIDGSAQDANDVDELRYIRGGVARYPGIEANAYASMAS
ncbi:hypothetical protein Dda_6280 [Drechslerella dactyloides]|uniref:Uncharacterized protein n=1 Tax=Drechslerella dactyloides TaxID=74499 RepID=A0AAD6IVF5_DREDA|nr:hypothetical protein Dda_6280 [Drechslerella dactyloides]